MRPVRRASVVKIRRPVSFAGNNTGSQRFNACTSTVNAANTAVSGIRSLSVPTSPFSVQFTGTPNLSSHVTFAVSTRAFSTVQRVDVEALLLLSELELRPLLPCLVRMALCAPLDTRPEWARKKEAILRVLSGIESVNSLVALLSIDFHALEADVRKEQLLRNKSGGSCESVLVAQLSNAISIEFERSDAARRLRLVLSQLLSLMAAATGSSGAAGGTSMATALAWAERCERWYAVGNAGGDLFSMDIYVDEVADVLCIAHAELPALLAASDMAEALLVARNGCAFIARLVANSPESFLDVCYQLIAAASSSPATIGNGAASTAHDQLQQRSDEEEQQRRTECLLQLCRMNPAEALQIRARAVEQCRLPELCVLLTLEQSSDIVAFVSGLLLSSDDKVRAWFAGYVRAYQRRAEPTALSMMRACLLQKLRSAIQVKQVHTADAEDAVSHAEATEGGRSIGGRAAEGYFRELINSQHAVVEMNALIRLFCALKVAGMKFSEDENQILLQLATTRCPATAAGARFVCLSLAMLLACPTLITSTSVTSAGVGDAERQIISHLRWVQASEAREGVAELLLLVAIHFHANQLAAIGDLVCATLGMRVSVRANSLSRMRALFVNDLFTEQVVTAHAARVPVTPQLTADVTGFLPVHCVYQLLKSRSFSKQRVSISDWVYRQLVAARPPLHPILPALIEVFVHSLLTPPAGLVGAAAAMSVIGAGGVATETSHQPFSDAQIIAASEAGSDSSIGSGQICSKRRSIMPSLLMLYYLLLYEDVRLANIRQYQQQLQQMAVGLMGRFDGRKVKAYSADLITRLPIRYLVQQAQQDQKAFGGLFAPLLRLLAHQFPHLCMTEDWLISETGIDSTRLFGQSQTSLAHFSVGTSQSTRRNKLCPKPVTPESLAQSLRLVETCPIGPLTQLSEVLELDLSEIWPFASPLVAALPSLLSPRVPRQLLEKARSLWFRLNQVYPRKLWVLTVNAFRPTETVTLDELIMDPLHVLRCHPLVRQCAVTLEMCVHMLRALLAAFRTQLSLYLAENLQAAPDAASATDREELRVALIATQESAAVQIMLEICLKSDESGGGEDFLSWTRECRTLVCSQLHQMFIADPQLVHLVHYQGYPAALLPITVSLVPSMHICLDFIPELLAHADLDKQLFGIELASYLCMQHAIPRSLSIARLCITVADTLLGVLPSFRRPQLFLSALPALVRMCRAFPPLSEDVVILLLKLAKVCLSQESTKPLPDIGEDDENRELCRVIQKSFSELGACNSSLNSKIY